jgi:O-antigen/teichoic acid export membrane protein
MGRNFAFYTDRFVQSIVKPVMFPLYSEIQGDPARVRGWMQVSFTAAIVLSGFISAGVYAAADLLLPMLLGDKWVPAIDVVKVLIVASGLYILIFSMSESLFKGLGRPDVTFKFQATKAVLIVVLSIYGITTYGLIGAAYALLASLLLMVPVWLYYVKTVTGQRMGFLVSAALVGLGPFAIIFVARMFIVQAPGVFSLVCWTLAGIVLCLLSFGLGYLLLPDVKESVKLVLSIRNKVKPKMKA